MLQLDFKKDYKALFNPSAKEVGLVEVPKLPYLMLDGTGDPNTSEEFQQAIEALFGLAYTLKFSLKKAGVVEYGVAPLEGQWWVAEGDTFSLSDKSNWLWTLMIMQPEQVTPELVAQDAQEVEKKKGSAAARQVRLASLEEGLAAQIMHLGPFATEEPTVAKLYDFIQQKGYQKTGKHHEIYLNDFRRSAPEKLKTVIRQPVTGRS